MNKLEANYPVGAENHKWDENDRKTWLSKQKIQRSYQQEVLDKLEPLKTVFEIVMYGELTYAPDKYPLFIAKTHNWDMQKPFVLITGGVHGYETSGVQGALRFLETEALNYSKYFNLIIAPCISPWGYETINRWNPYTVDPNRSFNQSGEAEEALLLMKYIEALNVTFTVHIDLHETTDTDNSEFRPALAARDNVHQPYWDIPDGLYLVGDSEKPVPEFQKAIIQGVSKVTHIAPSDENGNIIGVPSTQQGVINYEISKLGLCTGMTNCIYSSTTEVYPDSPTVDDENCIQAQIAAVCSGLDYVIEQLN